MDSEVRGYRKRLVAFSSTPPFLLWAQGGLVLGSTKVEAYRTRTRTLSGNFCDLLRMDLKPLGQSPTYAYCAGYVKGLILYIYTQIKYLVLHVGILVSFALHDFDLVYSCGIWYYISSCYLNGVVAFTPLFIIFIPPFSTVYVHISMFSSIDNQNRTR